MRLAVEQEDLVRRDHVFAGLAELETEPAGAEAPWLALVQLNDVGNDHLGFLDREMTIAEA